MEATLTTDQRIARIASYVAFHLGNGMSVEDATTHVSDGLGISQTAVAYAVQEFRGEFAALA